MKQEILQKDCCYHIYNRGINSGKIFGNAENKSYFLKLYKKYLEDKISTFSYCLMDNHFHLVIKIDDDPEKVLQAFSNFLNAYAKAFNKAENRTGSLFEKHFKRIQLKDENYMRNLILYVQLNPKLHLDQDFENFRFSSYQSILSYKNTLLKRDEVLTLFDTRDNFKFVHKFKNMEIDEKYKLK